MSQPTEPAHLAETTRPAEPAPPAGEIRPAPLVLMYHSVDHFDEDPHLVTVSPARFARQMAWLRARGLRGAGMGELLAAHAAGRARGLVGLTFDDGYADFATRALPVLVRYGFGATAFIVSGRIGSFNAWDDGPRKPLMTADQIRMVADAGMEIASHGRHHVSLPATDETELREELEESRAVLEDLIDGPVTGFAYPYGHATAREAEAVRAAGYDYACDISPEQPGRHALARTYIGDRDGPLRLRVKLVRHELRRRRRV
ncbi:polysaccharide deacetylase family protein [Actinomadura madurae]|uniref:polysaccharide deacetylase family protein n=1 Tax=Actinomadura madurae TaxID=1993 RepID=UPI0020D23DE6|nr:polysaccharide deacetylase family protein [Actinomadura madurae]MCP9980751.1 polysaccharide deacetylase family protein [Actinomadura madurae]MCQ0016948.1 polysaccharide deacetylase family protein [Actinomadura madurae]